MKKKPNNGIVKVSIASRITQSIRTALSSPQKAPGAFFLFCAIIVPQFFYGEFDYAPFTGRILLCTLYFCLFVFCLCGARSTGKELSLSEFYFLSVLAVIYFIPAFIVNNDSFYGGEMPISVVFPTALITLLISIIVRPRHARLLGILLPVGAFITGGFDESSLWFALASGISASYMLKHARRRIDMFQAGLSISVVHVIVMLSILLIKQSPTNLYAPLLAFAALGGIASGILVLGITPLIEKMLHCATEFRLIELLDLDTPLMKQLAQKTPGTFQHSLVVANLAEAACLEIGARSLLGRVGAYYHDIGKIDQPEYFVENQHDFNKHSEINPRLSATVIRSHVKVGIEKGRAAGLPNEVIDIIASHHGNSLIAYFYNEAKKREENVDMEDFCYPGEPPRTKEAAVVMLADVTEAAVRTLDKPGTSRIEKFINDLITRKIDSEQLASAEITFRELETIKKVFVRVLASYYHTRIEYPNQKECAKEEAQ
jgi:putative nucleotidyltransferase with HDIG domain